MAVNDHPWWEEFRVALDNLVLATEEFEDAVRKKSPPQQPRPYRQTLAARQLDYNRVADCIDWDDVLPE